MVKKSQPISTRMPEVIIEYTSRGRRVQKHFKNAHKAKSFYIKCSLEADPKVLKVPTTATR